MNESPESSPRLCRALSVALFVLATGILLIGTIACPPVLEAFVLADGNLGGMKGQIAFYGITAICMVAAIGAFCLGRRLRNQAHMINASRLQMSLMAAGLMSVLGIGVAEVAARMLVPRAQVLSGDAFWIDRWINQKEQGISTASVDHHDPDLGWVAQKNYRSEEVNTNSQGLRGLREHPFEKPDGQKRVVIIGDSFSFGFDVSDEYVYAELLDPQIEARVINLAGNGYGTDQQYLRLRQSGFDYQPDLVILGHFAPDADRNVLSFRDYAKPMFRIVDGELELTNVPIPAPEDGRKLWTAPSIPSYFWSLTVKGWRQALEETRFAPKWKITAALFDEILQLTRANGAKLLLVHIPTKRKAFTSEPEGSEVIFKDWAERNDVAFLNLRKEFRQLTREDRGKMYHGHWTPFGNQFVADAIAEKINSDNLVD